MCVLEGVAAYWNISDSTVLAGMQRLACINALVKLTDRHMYGSPIKILLLISMDGLPSYCLSDNSPHTHCHRHWIHAQK